MVDKKFIKKLQGNDFITHEGLLDEFHKNDGQSIETELISWKEDTFIFKAKVMGKKGTFEAHGDADNINVNSNIAKHKIRMAETRAINRALRLYNNIGMCSVDEMTNDEKDSKPKAGSFGKDVKVPNKCSSCNADVTDKVKDYSIDKYQKVLCMSCQEKEKKKEG